MTRTVDLIALTVRVHRDSLDEAARRASKPDRPALFAVGTAFRRHRQLTLVIHRWEPAAGVAPPTVGGWVIVLRRTLGTLRPTTASVSLPGGLRPNRDPVVELLVDENGAVYPVAAGVPAGGCELVTVPDLERCTFRTVMPDPLAPLPRTGSALGEERRAVAWSAMRVAVIGAGPLGGLTAERLLSQGVRRFVLTDGDTLTPGNFDGQAVLGRAVVSTPKVLALAKNLARIAPGAAVTAVRAAFPAADTPELVAGADVVVSAIDENRTRLRVGHQAYALAHQPHLDLATRTDPATGRSGADVRLLLPGRGCLLCLGAVSQPERPPAPAPGTSSRIINGIAAHLGVKLLLAMLARPSGAASCWMCLQTQRNGAVSVTRTVTTRPATDCPWCARAKKS